MHKSFPSPNSEHIFWPLQPPPHCSTRQTLTSGERMVNKIQWAVSIIYWLFVSWGSLLKPFGLNRKPVARKSKTGWKYQTFSSTTTFDTHTHWMAHTQKKEPKFDTIWHMGRGSSEGETNLFRVFLWLIFIFFSIRDVLNNLLWGDQE